MGSPISDAAVSALSARRGNKCKQIKDEPTDKCDGGDRLRPAASCSRIHILDSDPVPTLVSNSRPVFNFGLDFAFDNDFVDLVPRQIFSFDFASSPSSDLDEAGGKC
ncbi:hypothetical protein EVAR_49928_1 [Eumeta japonica]|uniref:Uncharacterized protein n=1 Tax=Eumeta variegata TaxID=151549 RepID=A0A4C1Y5K6_EUMVA|nr:hypothetical protein EVAR_49928_1 [Eumeta japonica]